MSRLLCWPGNSALWPLNKRSVGKKPEGGERGKRISYKEERVRDSPLFCPVDMFFEREREKNKWAYSNKYEKLGR